MILLVDHKDSFTRNLEHLLSEFEEVVVLDRLEATEAANSEKSRMVVLSPGPGKPADYPETQALYHQLRGKKPILGVCLGFQLMLEEEGATIVRQPQVLHGVETEIETDPESITYEGIEPPVKVGRYHSLQVECSSLSSLPTGIRTTARDRIRNVPLSFEDCERRLFGIQYHPESFLTSHGHAILTNVIRYCLG
jgi:anthranilate synthase/aminodeoxychorismate synthase-like glutamine amidotransferase